MNAAEQVGSRESDRRFFQRLPHRAVFRILDPENPATDQFAILQDISRSGVRVEVARQVAPGLLLTLYLPKTQFGPPRRITARVLRCTPSAQTVGWFDLGCRFSR